MMKIVKVMTMVMMIMIKNDLVISVWVFFQNLILIYSFKAISVTNHKIYVLHLKVPSNLFLQVNKAMYEQYKTGCEKLFNF